MKLHINDETAPLQTVILGTGYDRGCPRSINPMMRMHLKKNTFPRTENICEEIKQLEEVLKNNNIEVLRPTNIPGLEQIFVRDIGFVIEDYFFISNMKHKIRVAEIQGIMSLIKEFRREKVVRIPKEIFIEGGDVIPWKDKIFVGIGDRTSINGARFLQTVFPNKQVLPFELVVDQKNVDKNILHLDCTFQPIGTNQAIIYLGGFKKPPLKLLELFPKKNLVEINLEQKNRLFPNVFSISPNKILIEKGFGELKHELLKRKYEVLEVDYAETSKLNGLLRCSILPLRRAR